METSKNSFYSFTCLHEDSKNKFVTFCDIAWARLRELAFLTLALRNVGLVQFVFKNNK